MNLPDFESIDHEEFTRFVTQSTPDEIEFSISKMNLEQIKSVIQILDKGKNSNCKQKIRAAILGLNKRPQLEVASSQLSLDQVLELIDKTLQIEDKHHWKLSPIIVGLPFEVFSQLLNSASEKQLQLLQHEGVTEPVQHQITTLSHEFSNQIEQIENEIDRFCDEINNLNLEEIDREYVFEIHHRIGLFSEFFELCFQKANKALAIAWNTNRLDLIEILNKVKDSCQKYNIYGIGMPRGEKNLPSGLYSIIEDKLFSVYGNPNDTFDPEALRDDEPAIEGLAKFSVWYLKDYWEMGLLPSVKDPDDLDLDLSKHSEIKRARFREELFAQAKKNLEKIGLSTVSDLKKAYIFNKRTLREYIQEQSVTHVND